MTLENIETKHDRMFFWIFPLHHRRIMLQDILIGASVMQKRSKPGTIYTALKVNY